jgi:hypothetical protein
MRCLMSRRVEMELQEMKRMIRQHLRDTITPALEPLIHFMPERAHEVMSIQLDPRFCRGGIFVMLAQSRDDAKGLMKRYTDECLVPALISLKQHMQQQRVSPFHADTARMLAHVDTSPIQVTMCLRLCCV